MAERHYNTMDAGVTPAAVSPEDARTNSMFKRVGLVVGSLAVLATVGTIVQGGMQGSATSHTTTSLASLGSASTSASSSSGGGGETRRVRPDFSNLFTPKDSKSKSATTKTHKIKLDPTIVPAPLDASLSGGGSTRTCSLCESEVSVDCLDVMEEAYSDLNDKDSLVFLKAALSGWESYCDGLSDKECLTTLDSHLRINSNAERFQLLLAGCATYYHDEAAVAKDVASVTDVAAEVEAEASVCAYCDGLDDESCLTELETLYKGLNDKDSLDFLRDAIPDWETSACVGLTDKACLASLDSYMTSQHKESRLAVLEAGCENYYSVSNMPDPSVVRGNPKNPSPADDSSFTIRRHRNLRKEDGANDGATKGTSTSKFLNLAPRSPVSSTPLGAFRG